MQEKNTAVSEYTRELGEKRENITSIDNEVTKKTKTVETNTGKIKNIDTQIAKLKNLKTTPSAMVTGTPDAAQTEAVNADGYGTQEKPDDGENQQKIAELQAQKNQLVADNARNKAEMEALKKKKEPLVARRDQLEKQLIPNIQKEVEGLQTKKEGQEKEKQKITEEKQTNNREVEKLEKDIKREQ